MTSLQQRHQELRAAFFSDVPDLQRAVGELARAIPSQLQEMPKEDLLKDLRMLAAALRGKDPLTKVSVATALPTYLAVVQLDLSLSADNRVFDEISSAVSAAQSDSRSEVRAAADRARAACASLRAKSETTRTPLVEVGTVHTRIDVSKQLNERLAKVISGHVLPPADTTLGERLLQDGTFIDDLGHCVDTFAQGGQLSTRHKTAIAKLLEVIPNLRLHSFLLLFAAVRSNYSRRLERNISKSLTFNLEDPEGVVSALEAANIPEGTILAIAQWVAKAAKALKLKQTAPTLSELQQAPESDDAEIERVRRNIRRAIDQSGLTQHEVAVRMGYAASGGQTAVSRLLKRGYNPRLKTVIALARAIGLRPADFF